MDAPLSLRDLRKRAGLTLEAAAEKIGVDFSGLSKAERRIQRLRDDQLAKAFHEYGCTDEEIRRALDWLRGSAAA